MSARAPTDDIWKPPFCESDVPCRFFDNYFANKPHRFTACNCPRHYQGFFEIYLEKFSVWDSVLLESPMYSGFVGVRIAALKICFHGEGGGYARR